MISTKSHLTFVQITKLQLTISYQPTDWLGTRYRTSFSALDPSYFQ